MMGFSADGATKCVIGDPKNFRQYAEPCWLGRKTSASYSLSPAAALIQSNAGLAIASDYFERQEKQWARRWADLIQRNEHIGPRRYPGNRGGGSSQQQGSSRNGVQDNT